MSVFYQLDIFLFQFINQNASNSFFDWFFPTITDLHKNKFIGPLLLLLIFLNLIFKFKFKGLLIFLILGLSLSFSDFIGGRIKRVVNRPRPFQNLEISTIQRSPASRNTSFYSNHASNNFTFAGYLSFFYPKVKPIFYLISILISYSRVYNGVHYPADIFIGALMGFFWGHLFYFIYLKILKMISYYTQKGF